MLRKKYLISIEELMFFTPIAATGSSYSLDYYYPSIPVVA